MFTSAKHKRSRSSLSSNKRVSNFDEVPPIPPPRSAPATCRRPRRNIGDTIFITSSSRVYVNYQNDDITITNVNYLNETCEIVKQQRNKNIYANSEQNDVTDIAKFKLIVIEGYNRELQEINCFIGISCFLFLFYVYRNILNCFRFYLFLFLVCLIIKLINYLIHASHIRIYTYIKGLR